MGFEEGPSSEEPEGNRKAQRGSTPLGSIKKWGISDNGSTSALQAESRGSIPLYSTVSFMPRMLRSEAFRF